MKVQILLLLEGASKILHCQGYMDDIEIEKNNQACETKFAN
jgi:hypothetical protein